MRGECAEACYRLHIALPHHECPNCCRHFTVNKCRLADDCKFEHHRGCRARTQEVLAQLGMDPESIFRSPPPARPPTPPHRFEGVRAFSDTPKHAPNAWPDKCTLPADQVARLLLDLKVARRLGDATLMGEVLIRLHEGRLDVLAPYHPWMLVQHLPRFDETLFQISLEYQKHTLQGNPIKATTALVDFVFLLSEQAFDAWLSHLPLPPEQEVSRTLAAARISPAASRALYDRYFAQNNSRYAEPIRNRLQLK